MSLYVGVTVPSRSTGGPRRGPGGAVALGAMQCDYFDAGRCRSCALMGVPYAVQLADKRRRWRAARWPTSPRTSTGSSPSPAPSRPSATRPSSSSAAHRRRDRRHPRRRGPRRRPARVRPARAAAAAAHPAPRRGRRRDRPRAVRRRRPPRRAQAPHRDPLPHRRGHAPPRPALAPSPRAARVAPADAARPAAGGGRRLGQPPARAQGRPRGRHRDRPDARDVLAMPVNGLTLNLRPNSFFQTNTAVAAGLYRQAQDWTASGRPTPCSTSTAASADSRCHCAGGRRPRVPRRRGLRRCRASAERSARELRSEHPDVGDVEFRVGDATDVGALDPDLLGSGASMVVVNPPRRGIGPDLARLARAVRGRPRHLLELQRRQPRPRPRAPAVVHGATGAPLRHVPADVAPRGHRAARDADERRAPRRAIASTVPDPEAFR